MPVRFMHFQSLWHYGMPYPEQEGDPWDKFFGIVNKEDYYFFILTKYLLQEFNKMLKDWRIEVNITQGNRCHNKRYPGRGANLTWLLLKFDKIPVFPTHSEKFLEIRKVCKVSTIPKFTLGSDPEAFLVNEQGEYVSAIDKIGGSKEVPRPLEELGQGFAVQEDNVAIEFNVPPADSKEQFIQNITKARSYLEQEVGRMGLAFSKQSATPFPISELMHPKAMEFGCDPDYNAWTGKVNPSPKAVDRTLRSAGGHVHVGYKFKDATQAKKFVRYLDLFMGVPATLMDDGELRKELYGKRGACRIKPYGVEYRTLSNFWIFNDKHIGWVWDQTERALDAWQKNVPLDRQLIADAINNNNKDAAQILVAQYGLEVV